MAFISKLIFRHKGNNGKREEERGGKGGEREPPIIIEMFVVKVFFVGGYSMSEVWENPGKFCKVIEQG